MFFAIAFLLHKKGKYPEPLPPSKNPAREYLEIAIIFGVLFILLIIWNIMGKNFPMVRVNEEVTFLNLYVLTSIVLPFVMEKAIRRRNLSFIGLKLLVRFGWQISLLIVILGIVSSLVGLLAGRGKPLSLLFLVGELFVVFFEEVNFRGVIQTRLETTIGQVKAWIISALIFGAIHIKADFLGPGLTWAPKGGVLTAFSFLVYQISLGALWGVAYSKTRSLIPLFVGHYLHNYLANILATIIL